MAKSSLISIFSLEYAPVYAVIILVLFVLLVDVMYYQFTKFTKIITIKSKYNAMKSVDMVEQNI